MTVGFDSGVWGKRGPGGLLEGVGWQGAGGKTREEQPLASVSQRLTSYKECKAWRACQTSSLSAAGHCPRGWCPSELSPAPCLLSAQGY